MRCPRCQSEEIIEDGPILFRCNTCGMQFKDEIKQTLQRRILIECLTCKQYHYVDSEDTEQLNRERESGEGSIWEGDYLITRRCAACNSIWNNFETVKLSCECGNIEQYTGRKLNGGEWKINGRCSACIDSIHGQKA